MFTELSVGELFGFTGVRTQSNLTSVLVMPSLGYNSDNDIELFIDPDGDGLHYYEFEINALGTWWQLTLDKPYSAGGSARDVALRGLLHAVHIDGTLNDPSSSPDRGWSTTIALPLDEMAQFGGGKIVPNETVWRANFSRVQWKHRVTEDGKYERIPPHGVALPQGSEFDHPEENWTWCTQAKINMHDPSTWGFIAFT